MTYVLDQQDNFSAVKVDLPEQVSQNLLLFRT